MMVAPLEGGFIAMVILIQAFPAAEIVDNLILDGDAPATRCIPHPQPSECAAPSLANNCDTDPSIIEETEAVAC